MEREVGGRYSVDVRLSHDISLAASSDRIADTIDYRGVHRIIQEIGRGEPFRLIETLAVRIVSAIFREYSVEEVWIRIRKETPVLDGIVDAVGVEVLRRRSEG